MLRTYLVYNTVVRLCQIFLLWQESFITTGKKHVLVICLVGCAVVSVFGSGNYDRLSGGCAIIITTKKKSSSRLSGGCAIVITTGKKKF